MFVLGIFLEGCELELDLGYKSVKFAAQVFETRNQAKTLQLKQSWCRFVVLLFFVMIFLTLNGPKLLYAFSLVASFPFLNRRYISFISSYCL